MKRLRVIFTIFFLMPLFVFMSNSFAQINWTKHENPVLLAGSAGEWDDEGVFVPYVIYDGNTYKMWYSGRDGSHFRIGYATSPDGINWSKYNDPSTVNPPYAESDPVLNPGPGNWENDNVYAQTVYFDGANYQMWYIGNEGTTDHVGYASSPDGIAWTKNGNPVLNPGSSGSWDDAGIGTGPIFFNGSKFELIYNGYDGLHFQGGYATSFDGISWTKSVDPILLYGQPESWDNPRAQPGSVVFNSNTSKYYLFYSGGAVYNWRIGYATSSSFGGPWTKDTSILLDVTSGSWENNFIAFPSVVEDLGSSHYKMWYSSQTTSGPYGIGYATADMETIDTIYIPTDYSTIQEGIDVAETGNIILVDEGTYYENINFRGKAITVASRFLIDDDTLHISKTIIDGSKPTYPDSGSVVTFNSGEDTNSVLCGFTITGGTGTLTTPGFYHTHSMIGGGIYAANSARISHNIITLNALSPSGTADLYGAGIYASVDSNNYVIIEYNSITHNSITGTVSQIGGGGIGVSGTVRLIQNSITDNTLQNSAAQWNANGGGIVVAMGNVYAFGNLIARNSALAPNCQNATFGGGIHTFCTNIELYNNKIIDNLVQAATNAPAYGGGINVAVSNEVPGWPQGKIIIESNIISRNRVVGNTQSQGGAIYVWNEKPLIQNNIIVKNIAYSGSAVGMYRDLYTTPPTLINNTITKNRAIGNQGGAISTAGSWTPNVINTIAWGDTGSSEIHVISGSINVVYSDIEGSDVYPGKGNINADPQFADTMYHLTNSSPCLQTAIDTIELGSNSVCYTPV